MDDLFIHCMQDCHSRLIGNKMKEKISKINKFLHSSELNRKFSRQSIVSSTHNLQNLRLCPIAYYKLLTWDQNFTQFFNFLKVSNNSNQTMPKFKTFRKLQGLKYRRVFCNLWHLRFSEREFLKENLRCQELQRP